MPKSQQGAAMTVRFNGWQRIGIVLSVLWLIVALFIERHKIYDPIYTSYDHCVYRTLDWSVCDKDMDDAVVEASKTEPFTYAIVALGPTLALWLFGYVIAWIRRGNQPKSA
jgi:hypothetical protein